MINKYFILSLAFFSTNNLRVVYANPLEGKEEITSKEILQNCVGKESSIRCV